jgi:hypothetical protein
MIRPLLVRHRKMVIIAIIISAAVIFLIPLTLQWMIDRRWERESQRFDPWDR